FLSVIPPPPTSTLFPYTTLFRSLLVSLLSPLALPRRTRLLLAPFCLVFLIANVVVFQPWDWDNTKVLVFWYLAGAVAVGALLHRSEEHTSELQSLAYLVCRLLLE